MDCHLGLIVAIMGPLICAGSTIVSANGDGMAIDIKGTSLQQLMNLSITTLSRKSEPLAKAPAAVYVLTRNDIRRMGVTHIAEALRYVPGVEVARDEAGKWDVGIRGFGSSNKMLVLIDGRSIYSTLFSGVLWEEKDVLLDDVDRIEVVRGPGGTLWGANAVNGVINIITRNAEDTQGGLLTAGSGLEERGLVQGRYGWQMSNQSYARVYGKAVNRDDSGGVQTSDPGLGVEDNSEHEQTGFRMDFTKPGQDSVTLQGDYYRGENGSGFQGFGVGDGEEYHGGNLLVNWNHNFSEVQRQQLLFYYDTTTLENTNLFDEREIWNLEYQYQHQFSNHDIVVGLGYRIVSDNIDGSSTFIVDPKSREDELKSAFIQDDITPFGEQFHFIIGTKYEVNDYSGEEWQPSLRLSYEFTDSVIWAAWSHAVRVPTRLEHDVIIAVPPLTLSGEQNLNPEQAEFYELGWRKSWSKWQMDLATYYGDYKELQSIELPTLGNEMSGNTQGIEVSLSYQAIEEWLIRMNASHLEMDMELSPDSMGLTSAESVEDGSPRNQLQIVSYWDISASWQLNTYLRYMDEIQSADLPSYAVVDLSIVWTPIEAARVQLVGRHLGDEHYESNSAQSQVEQDAAIYLSWQF